MRRAPSYGQPPERWGSSPTYNHRYPFYRCDLCNARLLLLLLALLLLRPVTAAQSAQPLTPNAVASRWACAATALPLSLCALLVEPSPVPRCKWPPLRVGQLGCTAFELQQSHSQASCGCS